jgi:ribosome-interacting GTPase 1
MKQTAVEWLVEQYKKVGGISISMANQAKEMEKEQIIEAFNQGNIHEGNFFDRVNITAEQYYNETFKSE